MTLLTLGAGGAWATVTQPTLTTDVNNPHYYTIRSYRSSNYATFNGENLALTHEPGIGWGSVWYFVQNGEGISIVPAANPSMKVNSSKIAAESGDVWYLKESSITGYFCISLSSTDVTDGTSTTKDCWDASNSSTSIGNWYNKTGDNGGTSWTIDAISSEDVEALRNAYTSMIPDLPTEKYLSIGAQATTITAATTGSDNDHWYIISQDRGGTATPMYNTGYYTNLYRAATSVTPASLENQSVSSSTIYLVRFVDAGDGLFNIQFADGSYIVNPTTGTPADGNNPKLTTFGPHAKFAFTLIDGSTRFSWNLHSATGKSMDNNGANGTVCYWGEGTVTDDTSTKSWIIQPVTFTDAISYPFNTTSGAFFSGLTTNKTSSDSNYCNLWLSKNATGKPQLKLISNDASASAGNNMRSSGGLYTTTSATGYTYNLSVSEGKITSYTIVGTAVGALSIKPDGGSAEEFSASASVNKKVTLDTPAKQTSFKLTTLGSGAQWLNVSQFIIEYESDATMVSSLSDITSDGIYMLEPHNAERGIMYAGTAYMDACGGHANTNYPANKATAIDATDPNQQFVLYTYGGNTYLYNVGRAKFAGVADGLYYKLTGAPVNTWSVSAGAYDNYFHLMSGADSKMATINAWTNTGGADSKDYAITGQTDNEEANNLLLKRVGTLTSDQQTAIETIITNYLTLQSSLATLSEYPIGTGLGTYNNASLATDEAKENLISDIQEGLKDCASSDIPTANSNVTSLISAMSLNMPSSNSFLRFKANATGKYIGFADSGKQPLVDEEYAGVYLYTADKNFISYNQGCYLSASVGNAVTAVGTVGGAFNFYETAYSTPTRGTYRIRVVGNGSGSIIAWTDGYLNGWGEGDHSLCEWIVEEVTSLPVTFAGEYASFYSPVDLTIPDGVEAYTGTVNGDYLTLNEVTGTLPANTGVILRRQSEGTTTVYFPVLSTTTPAESALTGSVAAQAAVDGGVLVLGKNEDVWGIYNYEGALGGFKAYMTKSAGVKGLRFDFGNTTAIEEVLHETLTDHAAIYNLAGQRLNKLQRGINLVNGKKVLVK